MTEQQVIATGTVKVGRRNYDAKVIEGDDGFPQVWRLDEGCFSSQWVRCSVEEGDTFRTDEEPKRVVVASLSPGEDFLRRLQAEAKQEAQRSRRTESPAYLRRLDAWVDDNSEVARVLRAMDEEPS